MLSQLENVDYVPTNIAASSQRAKMTLLEDNEAVIKMCIKGRSPNLRHVARTHRVDLDWLFERIHNDSAINMKYVGTKEQMADTYSDRAYLQRRSGCHY